MTNRAPRPGRPWSAWWPASLVLPALLVLTVAGCGLREPPAPSAADEVLIPSMEAPNTRMPNDPIPAQFKLPPGNGPFPAVIVLHGCAGLGPSQLIWARRLNGWGYAAIIPDSNSPRGVARVCEPEKQALVTPLDRVGDVGSAAAWLRKQPRIDPNRIAVLGLSHGGATAELATEQIYSSFRLRAAIDYYGPCVDPAAHGTVPLLVLVGDSDDWGQPALRCQAFGAALRPDQPFEIHVYPDVFHAFDNPAMTRSVSNGHVMEYNRSAAEDSFKHVHAFLDHWDGR